MNFIGITFTALFCAALMFLPRRFAVLAVFAAVCYITQGQGFNVGGFNFFAQRIVLLAGFIRILTRGELKRLKLNKIDWAILALAIISTVVPGMRTGVWQQQVGGCYDTLLSYFVFRCLITSWEDIQDLLPRLAILIIPLALCMIYESRTGSNVFNVMGGQGAEWLREGRYRCMGGFRGPHTAGVFGATLMPLFVWWFFRPGQRRIAVAGLLAATAITFTANSSGPLMAYLSGLIGLAFWPLRKDMRRVRRGIVAALVVLALVMKAPIWYILAKVSDVTGGDGWYRSYLMEQCFNHFSDWWLTGTDDTSGWAAALMPWGGADLCNIYVACAATGGLACLVCFVLVLVWCFQYLGRALNAARVSLSENEGLLWCCGCVLFAHVCTLFSITYWDQFFVIWWGFLAMISSVTSSILAQPFAAATSESEVETHEEEIPA
ncbi:MAG: hypothetical protein ABSA83_01640 [Verrucomicrobiota bacterium]|jgi:hypothetical protein